MGNRAGIHLHSPEQGRKLNHDGPVSLLSLSLTSLINTCTSHVWSDTNTGGGDTSRAAIPHFVDEFDDTVSEPELMDLFRNADNVSHASYHSPVRALDLECITPSTVKEIRRLLNMNVEMYKERIPFSLMCERLDYSKRRQRQWMLTERLYGREVMDDPTFEWKIHPKDRKLVTYPDDDVDNDPDDSVYNDPDDDYDNDCGQEDDNDFSILVKYY